MNLARIGTPVAVSVALAALIGCGGASTGPVFVAIGGAVQGLVGSGLVLTDNAQDQLALASNGAFTFVVMVPAGGSYSVGVLAQPTNPSQTCAVSNAVGRAGNRAVTNIEVLCTTNSYRVGGTLSGLAGSTVVLTNNAAESLTVSGGESFAFPTAVTSGATYAVAISTQSSDPTLHCTLSNGAGTVGGADVTNLAVRCANAARFVYINEYLSLGTDGSAGLPPGGVLAYAVDPLTGTFQLVGSSLFATDICPCSLAVTADGRFAYLGSGDLLYTYSIDAVTGALTATGDKVGATAGALVVTPDNKFAYLSSAVTASITAYAIDPVTGALNTVPGSPVQTGAHPTAAAVDPRGAFLYVANAGSGDISAFRIDRQTGALASVAGSPFAAGADTDVVTIDSGGRFLYATHEGRVPVTAFVIDAISGALAPLPVPLFEPALAATLNGVFFVDSNSNRAYVVGFCVTTPSRWCAADGNFLEPFVFDLWTFAIDDRTGELVERGPPHLLFTTDEMSDLSSVQIDPSGKFDCARVLHGTGMGLYDVLWCRGIDASTGAPGSGYGGGASSATRSGAARVEAWGSITLVR